MCAASSSKADLTPIFVSATPSGVNTVFRYDINLSTGSSVNGGGVNDFVTIYDFLGYIPNSRAIISSIGTWTPSEQALGLNPTGFTPAVDTAALNISFTYLSAANSLKKEFPKEALEFISFHSVPLYAQTSDWQDIPV